MTKCRACKAGWTRIIGEQGSVLIVCLLDRERVSEGLKDCDRFDRKEQA